MCDNDHGATLLSNAVGMSIDLWITTKLQGLILLLTSISKAEVKLWGQNV